LKITALVLASILAVLLAETLVRMTWRDRPQAVRYNDDNIFTTVDSPAVHFSLKPGFPFYYKGTVSRLNGQGLRNTPVAIPKSKNTFRILVLGDELVFGPGLRNSETLPARLEQVLVNHCGGGRFEVINAGIPRYNFARAAELLVPLSQRYRPDLVLAVLDEDDFELQGFGPGGRTPLLVSPWPQQPRPRAGLPGRLMLPDKKAPFRYALANASRAYLLTALWLKGTPGGAAPDPPPPDLRGMGSPGAYEWFDLPASSCCQSRTRVWDPLANRLGEIKKLGEENGFKFAAALYSDFHLRGRAALKLIDEFEKAGLPLINLSAYRDSLKTEKRKHTLRWSPWPNAAVAGSDALFTAHNMQRLGLLPEEAPCREIGIDDRPYEDLLRVRKKMYWDKVNEQLVRDKVAYQDFGTKIVFSKSTTFTPEQILYGWWPVSVFAWLGYHDVRWMSDEASVMLSLPKGATILHVKGRSLLPATDVLGPPEISFHFECQPSYEKFIVSGDIFETNVVIPRELRKRKQLEISIRCSNPFTPRAAGLRDDDRLLCVGFERLELE